LRNLSGPLCLVLLAAWTSSAAGAIRNTRTGSTYTTLQAAVNAAASGDTIEIDSNYTGSAVFASIAKNLTIRGVGATRPVLDGNFTCPNNHGILDINGGQTITIENLDLRNCQGASGGNGCGIRLSYPQNVTVRNCCFYNNEDGIMGANGGVANITLEYCEFNLNGWGDEGYTHNIYIGDCNSFIMRYCYSHNTNVGHEVKTRAHTSYILYNRIGNEGGSGSYEIDVPQGGTTYIIGNQVEQGPYTQNSTIISYKEESPTNSDLHLYVVNNTIVNDRGSGTFVRVSAGTALLQNNVFQGGGAVLNGSATQVSNYVGNAALANTAIYDYHLTAGSTNCIDKGTVPDPGTGIDGFSLIPACQYVHPCSYQARPVSGVIDIGAYEYFVNQPPTVDAGLDQSVYEGQTVHLHAAGSDPNTDPLAYAWTQTAGLTVTLSGSNTADASFTAPAVSTVTQASMTFQVSVNDGNGGTANDSVNVRVYLAGDASHNDVVDISDLLAVGAAWGTSQGSPEYDASCDFNNDGLVDAADVLMLADNWGARL
jgi:hypothetical protein